MRSLDDYFLPGESSLYLRSRRRSKKSSRHKSRHATHCRCHNRRGCVECSRLRSLEQLVKLVVSQERKIQEIGDRIYDTDVLIGRHESRIHNHRVQQNGLDYVQDSYLNSHSSESGSSMDRLSFTSLDLKDMGDVFLGSSRHELEEISRLCNDLAHVERRLEVERAKIQQLAPEVEELSRKMGVAAEIEGETNTELEDTGTEMIRAVTLHVTNEYNERELDRKIDVLIHLLSKKLDLYRELKDEVDVIQNSTEDDAVKPTADRDFDDEDLLPKVQNFPMVPTTSRRLHPGDSKNFSENPPSIAHGWKDDKLLPGPSRDDSSNGRRYVNLDHIVGPQSPSSLLAHPQVGPASPYWRSLGPKKTVTFASDKNIASSFSDKGKVSTFNHNLSSVPSPDSTFNTERGNLSETQAGDAAKVGKSPYGECPIENPEVEKVPFPRQPRPLQHLKDGLKIRSRSADRSSVHHRDRSPGLRTWDGADKSADNSHISARGDYNVHLVNQYGLDLATLPGPSKFDQMATYNTKRSENETLPRAENRGDKLTARENYEPILPRHKQIYDSAKPRTIREQSEQSSSSRGVTHTLDRSSGQGKQGEQQPFDGNTTNNRILTNRVTGGDSALNTQQPSLLRGIKDSSVDDHNNGHLFDHGISQPQKSGENNGERVLRRSANKGPGQRPAFLSARVVRDTPDSRDLASHSSPRPVHESAWNNASLSRGRETSRRGGSAHDRIPSVNHEVSQSNEMSQRFSHRDVDGHNGLFGNKEHVVRVNCSSSASDSGPEHWNNFVNSDLHDNHTYHASEAARAHRNFSNPPSAGQVTTVVRERNAPENTTRPHRMSVNASDDESSARNTRYADRSEQDRRRGSVDALGDRGVDSHTKPTPDGLSPAGSHNSYGFDNSSRGALYHIVTSKLNKTAELSPNFTNIDSPKKPINVHLNSQPHDISSGQPKLVKGDHLTGQQMSTRVQRDVSANHINSTLRKQDNKINLHGKGNNPGFQDHVRPDPGYLPFRPNGTVNNRLDNGSPYGSDTSTPANLMNGHIGQNTLRESIHVRQTSTPTSSTLSAGNTVNLKDIPANSQKEGVGTRGLVSYSRSHGNAVVGRTKVEDSNDSNSDTGLSSMHSDETANLVTLV